PADLETAVLRGVNYPLGHWFSRITITQHSVRTRATGWRCLRGASRSPRGTSSIVGRTQRGPIPGGSLDQLRHRTVDGGYAPWSVTRVGVITTVTRRCVWVSTQGLPVYLCESSSMRPSASADSRRALPLTAL